MKNEDVILVLPSWYPSEIEPSSGDFVQRHIEAIATYRRQYVIHLVKDNQGIITKNIREVFRQKNNYSELIIYYHIRKTGFPFLDQLRSDIRYRRIYRSAIKKFIRSNGLPTLVHVHVAMKAGLAAYWVKQKFSIPYIVTEHSTAYLSEADIRLSNYGTIFKQRTKKILKKSSIVTAVSGWLGKAIEQEFPFTKCLIIPNVYDSKIFFAENEIPSTPPAFVHASIMNFQKNTEGIIDAFKLVKERKKDFVLQLFGPINNNIIQLIEKAGIKKKVQVHGNVSQQDLASAIKNSKAVIMNSRFETFGCVLIEANACGIPAIITDIPVFHEIIEENINGIFVSQNDSAQLANAIINFIEEKTIFDKNKIGATAEKYKYENVGRRFNEVYHNTEIKSAQ
ncbi:MAG: glycosyltransferase family 4 protein [Bacteroidetes bacterium]|nr:glycosyltransferase family 4 protein [Bacteroidota bacterium]